MNPPEQPDISVIIVNWNSCDYVRQCLHSIDKHVTGLRLEILVVDNASHDGCGEMLAREFPRAIFIQSPENAGFARANNLGARQATGRCLLLLNPDTELREDSLSIMARWLALLPKAGAVGCKLLNTDGSLQTSCVQSFPTVLNQALDSEFFRGLFPRWSIWGTAPFRSSEPSQAEAISGACILVRREVFEEVGGFSSEYFMYGEDLDLCFKISRAGYAIYYVPETALVHFGGGSTRQSSDYSNVMMRESVYRFMRQNRGQLSAVCYRAAMACAAVARMILILPAVLLSRGPRMESLHKWVSIFRWSLGLRQL